MSSRRSRSKSGTPGPSHSISKLTNGLLSESTGLLQTIQNHVEEVRTLIQCGICVRPLYEPYTLACGHTFCYGCLTSWFGSGKSNKTCPDCRAQVKHQPAPAYLVRAIVQMFTSRAELLDKGETTEEHSKHKKEEAEKLEADRTNDHPRTGGLFQGSFKERRPAPRPILDPEDNVTRCPYCSWELEEDECPHCGFIIDGDLTVTDSNDGDSQMSDGGTSDDFGDDIEDSNSWLSDWEPDHYMDDPRFAGIPFPFAHPGELDWHEYLLNHARTYHPDYLHEENEQEDDDEEEEGEDEDEDEDEDDEMDSFIDDEELEEDSDADRSTVIGDYRYHGGIDPYSEATDVSHSEHGGPNEDEDDNEDEEGAEPTAENESSEDEEPIRPARSAGPTRHTGSEFSSRRVANWDARRRARSTANNNAQSSCPPSISTQSGLSANTAINIEDDSEDGGPVPPTRRSRPQRQHYGRPGYPY